MIDSPIRSDHALGIGLHRGKPAQTDEIYLGLWMGLNGLDSVGNGIGHETWMTSSWRAFACGLEFFPIEVNRKRALAF